jgi:hypothetical protein
VGVGVAGGMACLGKILSPEKERKEYICIKAIITIHI